MSASMMDRESFEARLTAGLKFLLPRSRFKVSSSSKAPVRAQHAAVQDRDMPRLF